MIRKGGKGNQKKKVFDNFLGELFSPGKDSGE
jgi:hypothetical protein